MIIYEGLGLECVLDLNNNIKSVSRAENKESRTKLLNAMPGARMIMINDLISDNKRIDKYFERFTKFITEGNQVKIGYLLETLFLQEVPIGFIDMIINTYNNTDKKDELIEELRKSYQAKGIDGMLHAWYPILKDIFRIKAIC